MSRRRRAQGLFLRTGGLILVCTMVLALTAYQAFASARPTNSSPPAAGQAAHYIVLEKHRDGQVVPLYYREVELPAPLHTLGPPQLGRLLAQGDRNSEQLVVTLESTTGETVYQNVVSVARWLRGEFHGLRAGEPIDGHWFPLDSAVFVVRVPVIEDTILTLRAGQLAPAARFNLKELISQTPLIDAGAVRLKAGAVQITGDPANRVDFLIMGDGYPSAEATKFESDATNMAAAFFDVTPLAEYANYVNVHSLFTVSSESGADHPPYEPDCSPSDRTCCGDVKMLSDPLANTFVNTAFDSRYCANGIHRLLVANTAKVLAAASAVPHWDQILLLVNDLTYGGSGGAVAIASLHSGTVDLARHEYGHSFAGLADEYESAYPGFPACSDINGPPCEANVTDVSVRAQIKWTPWITPTTPVPTEPEDDPMYADVVGLFEGARYLSMGMYRPGQNCLMRSLGRPFCQVPGQAYVLRLYDGGWGVPESGIDLIEPGTTSPAPDFLVLVHPASQVFQADVLDPVGATAEITWLVDHVPAPVGSGETFTYTTSAEATGLVEITLFVEDATPLVHPDMAGMSLQAEHTWTVLVASSVVHLPLVMRSY